MNRLLDERPQPGARLSTLIAPVDTYPSDEEASARNLPTGVRPKVPSIQVTGEVRGEENKAEG